MAIVCLVSKQKLETWDIFRKNAKALRFDALIEKKIFYKP
jgi:hypothetical protein